MVRSRVFTALLIILLPIGALSQRLHELPPPIQREATDLIECVKKGDFTAANDSVHKLAELRAQFQIVNLTPVVAAVLTILERSKTDYQTRAALLESLIQLAPDFPKLLFALSEAEARTGPAGVVRAISHALHALSLPYPRGLIVTVANISYYLTIVFVIFAGVTALLLLLRSLPLLVHDISDIFPSALPAAYSVSEIARSRRTSFIIGSGIIRALSLMVGILVTILPLAIGVGLLVAAAIWALLSIAYARRFEAVIAILVLIAIAMVTPLGMVANLPQATSGSYGEAVWSCLREFCPEEAAKNITAQTIKDGQDPWARAALALHEIQKNPLQPGVLEVAEEHLKAASTTPFNLALSGNISVLRAVAMCPAGNPERSLLLKAVAFYQEALKGEPSPEVMRGLAIAQGALDDRSAMEATLKELVVQSKDTDLSYIANIRSITTPSNICMSPQAIAAELRLPDVPFLKLFFSGVEFARLEPAIPWRYLSTGLLSPEVTSVVALLFIVVSVILLLIRKRLSLASSCPRCGTVSCRSCNIRSSGFDYCPTCLLEQVRPAFLDPMDVIAMQNRRAVLSHRKRLIVPALSLLVPGTGQILAGRPFRGAIMFGMLVLAIALVLMPVPPYVDPPGYTGTIGGRLPLAPPILLSVIYFMSALDTWLNRGK